MLSAEAAKSLQDERLRTFQADNFTASKATADDDFFDGIDEEEGFLAFLLYLTVHSFRKYICSSETAKEKAKTKTRESREIAGTDYCRSCIFCIVKSPCLSAATGI